MTREARVLAQAKINLFLRVLAREASGYHQLETLFCRLDLGDRVVVRAGGSGRSLDCAGPRMPDGGLGPVERNLAWRAAVAYDEAAGWPGGFAIEIEKRIPTGGGLGGGSADAGAVLRCLDALSPRPLGAARLLGLATTLGADVPFLTATAPLALAWGRGERMLALRPLPPRPVALFVFASGIPTADAYGWLAESRAAGPSADEPGLTATLLDRTALGSWRAVASLAHNDFERVVRPRYRVIDETLSALRGAEGDVIVGRGGIALLSGSGSTVFAIRGSARGHIALELESESHVVELVASSTASHVVPVTVSE